ncbi:capsular polysaccharide biosynthesis protein [Loktanella sp. D2R18]|uniref:capsular polysaccharide biosynthesis protein n=1 Tax=Rhodobacterales TaxID=204455 RepID=UPI000DE83FE5|nr:MULTISPECIES: capsular polysaccharide biosynthesis protein [Rhodobacterales]MDO6589111.1 capsular polysaccharide biosynthesis protein [Yoonia sp. 1_MG-2023]RBW45454.1 capsular polysaccharide biosynthesis protein [Loktanella sp. D2R18]
MSAPDRKNLFVYNGGLLTKGRVRRIVELAGYNIRLGVPGAGDLVGVWGHSPTAPRGEAVADHKEADIVRIEDSFLRSVGLGRDGDAPIGLNIDRRGVHFDPSIPSDLETILSEDPLDNTALLNRARAGIETLKSGHLSKYNAFDPALPVPDPGYVLVVDQTRKDASIKASGADSNTFREMLFFALTEHPGARVIIKTHPETAAGHRDGYFSEKDCDSRIQLCDAPLSPWALLEGAIAVYTVTSQLGFEAILAGHKPVVFGQPFYMGWGLSDDRKPLQRRQRKLTRAQLFSGAMLIYPKWYDPFHDRLCSFEEATATLAVSARAWRDDHKGWVAADMRMWKRAPLQKLFGAQKRVIFAKGKSAAKRADVSGRKLMRWANTGAIDATLVEDGFLRSRGLGADLIAPLSLVLDEIGIYYDATRPSGLENLINSAANLREDERARAAALISRILDAGLSKYNLSKQAPIDMPKGRRILVPGQVEDDASIQLGCTDVTTNQGLLQAARAANPAAIIAYKPHPDVEAGLRPGAVPSALQWADIILADADPIAALDRVDEIWTLTSLLGFEALLRGKKVTCLGMPFYAGWGLTDDRALPIPRRHARVDIVALTHAALIAYPRYFDPITGLPCPVEVVVDRLENNDLPAHGKMNRSLAKLQGIFASRAHLWRGR